MAIDKFRFLNIRYALSLKKHIAAHPSYALEREMVRFKEHRPVSLNVHFESNASLFF